MKVLVAGCFDVLHVGHFNLLMFCRQLAGPTGEVHVSLDSDNKIKIDKGDDRPIFTFMERKEAIESIKSFGANVVDHIHIHESNEELNLQINYTEPDGIVVGSDYRNKIVVGREKFPIHYFEIDSKFSSTKIIERCWKKY